MVMLELRGEGLGCSDDSRLVERTHEELARMADPRATTRAQNDNWSVPMVAGCAYADLARIGLQVDGHDIDDRDGNTACDVQGRHDRVQTLIAEMTLELGIGNRMKWTFGTHLGNRRGPAEESMLSVEHHRHRYSSQAESCHYWEPGSKPCQRPHDGSSPRAVMKCSDTCQPPFQRLPRQRALKLLRKWRPRAWADWDARGRSP